MTFCPFSPGVKALDLDSIKPDHLTGIDLQYYRDLFEVMTGNKYQMNPQDAEAEAMIIVKGSMKKLYNGDKSR